jgi:hypothetical protein
MPLVQKRIISAVRRVQFVSDRMSLDVAGVISFIHAPTEDKTDDVRAASMRNWNVFYKFPKYHMKILFGDFNAKVGREDILNRQLGMKVYMKLVMILELEP